MSEDKSDRSHNEDGKHVSEMTREEKNTFYNNQGQEDAAENMSSPPSFFHQMLAEGGVDDASSYEGGQKNTDRQKL